MYYEMHRLVIHPSYSLNILAELLAAIEQIVQMIITSTTKTSLAMFVSYFGSQNLPNWLAQTNKLYTGLILPHGVFFFRPSTLGNDLTLSSIFPYKVTNRYSR